MADAVEIAKERIATLAAEIGTSAAFRRQRANVRVGSRLCENSGNGPLCATIEPSRLTR